MPAVNIDKHRQLKAILKKLDPLPAYNRLVSNDAEPISSSIGAAFSRHNPYITGLYKKHSAFAEWQRRDVLLYILRDQDEGYGGFNTRKNFKMVQAGQSRDYGIQTRGRAPYQKFIGKP